jgi:tryptophan synthase beta chain
LESSHAIAWTLANGGSELDLVCLSGRGDKDLAEVIRRLELERGAAEEPSADASVPGGPAEA